jgi:hypothetical protein
VQRAVERLRDPSGVLHVPASSQLTRPWMRGTYDFSFSGLKTAVLRAAEGGSSGPVGNPSRLSAVAPSRADATSGNESEVPRHVAQLAAAFQEAVVDVLVGKTVQAAEDVGAKQIALAGGGYPYLTVNAYNAWAVVPSNLGISLAGSGQWVCDTLSTPADRCGTGYVQFGSVPAIVVGAVLLIVVIRAFTGTISRPIRTCLAPFWRARPSVRAAW